MGMSLNSGGHLTHGAKPTLSGKYFNVVQYDVDSEAMEIDYEELQNLINKHKPHLFIVNWLREMDLRKYMYIVSWMDVIRPLQAARILLGLMLLTARSAQFM